MAKEYIEKAALQEAMKHVYQDSTCPMHIAAEVDQYITEAPAADVVEVVRCKDCKEAYDGWENDDGSRFHLCNRYDWAVVKPDDFCSYGEKRDSDDG